MNATEELSYIDSPDKIAACAANASAAREAIGPNVGIGIDFHGRVHGPMVKALLRALEPYDRMFVEEPVLSENRLNAD